MSTDANIDASANTSDTDTSRSLERGALADVSDEAIEAAIPDRISSFRHLQVLYGALHSLATDSIGMTPNEADFRGQDSIVAVHVDLTGEEPTLRADDPVEVYAYTEELTPLLAHSRDKQAKNGYDFSPTHQIGSALTSSWVAKCLTHWPHQGAIGAIDDPLLDALRQLGADEDTQATVAEKGETALEQVTSDGALVTIRVAIPEDSEEQYAPTKAFDPIRTWHWPGEFEAVMRAIRKRREEKFASRNELDGAEGEGSGYVYGGTERLVGAPPDPLNDRGIWQTKSLEKFAGFDPNDSWRTASISDRAASMMGESARFVDACRYRHWQAKSPGDYLLWMLPSLSGELSIADARWLYKLLVAQLTASRRYERQLAAARDDDVSPVTPLDRLWARVHDETGQIDEQRAARLRVHVLGARIIDNDNVLVVLDEPAGSLPNAVALAGAHEAVLEDVANADYPPVSLYGGAAFLDPGQFRQHRLDYTATPVYFMATCAEPDDADPDDFRYMAATRVLTGRPLDAEALLSQYADRIREEFDASRNSPWPRETVAAQIVQLQALRRADLLTGDTGFQIDMTDTDTDTDADTDDSDDSHDDHDHETATNSDAHDSRANSDDDSAVETDGADAMSAATGEDGDAEIGTDANVDTSTNADADTNTGMSADVDVDMDGWYQSADPGDRERAIEAFIADRPPIDPDYEGHDDYGRRLATERQALVLMGALVSKVSAYQVESEGRSKTLSQSTEARGITPRNIERIVEDIYHYNTVYSSQEGRPLFWRDLMSRLSDKYTKVGSARDWQLPVSEFVAWFACGVVFGSELPSNDYESEGENEGEGGGEGESTATDATEAEPQSVDQHQETLQ